jgi:hypothetical protein
MNHEEHEMHEENTKNMFLKALLSGLRVLRGEQKGFNL